MLRTPAFGFDVRNLGDRIEMWIRPGFYNRREERDVYQVWIEENGFTISSPDGKMRSMESFLTFGDPEDKADLVFMACYARDLDPLYCRFVIDLSAPSAVAVKEELIKRGVTSWQPE